MGTDAAVYGDDSGRVTVLAAATGEVRWTAELGAAIVGPAAVAGDTIAVGTADGRLVALAAGGCGAATCAPLWEVPLGAAASSPPVVIGDVGTADGQVVALALPA